MHLFPIDPYPDFGELVDDQVGNVSTMIKMRNAPALPIPAINPYPVLGELGPGQLEMPAHRKR